MKTLDDRASELLTQLKYNPEIKHKELIIEALREQEEETKISVAIDVSLKFSDEKDKELMSKIVAAIMNTKSI